MTCQLNLTALTKVVSVRNGNARLSPFNRSAKGHERVTKGHHGGLIVKALNERMGSSQLGCSAL